MARRPRFIPPEDLPDPIVTQCCCGARLTDAERAASVAAFPDDGTYHCAECLDRALKGEPIDGPQTAPVTPDAESPPALELAAQAATAEASAGESSAHVNGEPVETPTTSAPLFDTVAFNADDAFHEIARLNETLRAAHNAWELAKDEVSTCRKRWERLTKELSDVIQEREAKRFQAERAAVQPTLILAGAGEDEDTDEDLDHEDEDEDTDTDEEDGLEGEA